MYLLSDFDWVCDFIFFICDKSNDVDKNIHVLLENAFSSLTLNVSRLFLSGKQNPEMNSTP